MVTLEASVVRTDGDVSLRLPGPGDAAHLACWGADLEFARYQWATEPWAEPELLAARFLDRFIAMPPAQGRLFMVESARSGGTIGYVNYRDVRARVRGCEIAGAMAEREHWVQGIGGAAVRMLLDYLFGSMGLHKVTVRVVAFNTPAIRSFERCGFRTEGLLHDAYWLDNRWWDSLQMAVLEDDWAALQAVEG